MRKVYFFIDDLIVRSQVQVALQESSASFEFITSLEQISSPDDSSMLAVFDLSTGDVSMLKQFREKFPSAQTLAFLPHVREDIRAAAVSLGCQRVVSRFEFSKNIAALIDTSS
jgi:hypothetical protein